MNSLQMSGSYSSAAEGVISLAPELYLPRRGQLGPAGADRVVSGNPFWRTHLAPANLAARPHLASMPVYVVTSFVAASPSRQPSSQGGLTFDGGIRVKIFLMAKIFYPPLFKNRQNIEFELPKSAFSLKLPF